MRELPFADARVNPGAVAEGSGKVQATADDEAVLTADIIAFATQFGRYGYRRIAAMLETAGWTVNLRLPKGLGLAIVFFDEAVDGGLKADDEAEDIPLQAPSGDRVGHGASLRAFWRSTFRSPDVPFVRFNKPTTSR